LLAGFYTSPWLDVLFVALLISNFTFLSVGTVTVAIKRFPKYRSGYIEQGRMMIIGTAASVLLGYSISKLLSTPIVYEKEFASGIMTASSVVIALSAALFAIAKFPATERGVEDYLANPFKISLIVSLIAGLVTLFLTLFWYAKDIPSLLQWALFSFAYQLLSVMVFLFFPKYYAKK
jgi:small-conductance mechanosensitive channel